MTATLTIPIDLEAVRSQIHLWLEAIRTEDDDAEEYGMLGYDPSLSAMLLLQPEKDIEALDIDPELRSLAMSTALAYFGDGVDLGIALAVAIIQSPMTDPRERWGDLIDDTRDRLVTLADSVRSEANIIKRQANAVSVAEPPT